MESAKTFKNVFQPVNVLAIFIFVFEETRKRASLLQFDGLRWWQNVFKGVLSKYDTTTTTWSLSKTRRRLESKIWPILKFMPEEHILAGGDRVTIKEVHFLAQLHRLPQEPNLTLRKLCQVALNAAQLGAFIDAFQLKDWRVYSLTLAMYSNLSKIESYADADTQEMLGVALAASGCQTEQLLAQFRENIRIFDSGV